MEVKKDECKCKKCIECCSHSCGWFGSIEEVEGAAKIMGMDLIEFAREYLIEEWWAGEEENGVIAPRKDFTKMKLICNDFVDKINKDEALKNGKGFVRASWGHNLINGVPCIFLDENNLCMINGSKPQECRESFGCNKGKFEGREKIVKYWDEHKEFVEKLKENVRRGK